MQLNELKPYVEPLRRMINKMNRDMRDKGLWFINPVSAYSACWKLISIMACTFSSPEHTILLAWGRNRELWEQPFQACTIDADYVKPDGQNSVISLVISNGCSQSSRFPTAGQGKRRLWEQDCFSFAKNQLDLTLKTILIQDQKNDRCLHTVIWNWT